jgi:hypothetical protein
VHPVLETTSATDVREQLECRLAVGILEVLSPQPEAMHAQEKIPLGVCDMRDLLGQIA